MRNEQILAETSDIVTEIKENQIFQCHSRPRPPINSKSHLGGNRSLVRKNKVYKSE